MSSSLRSRLDVPGLTLTPEAVAQLETYRDRLLEATQRFNLTALRSAVGIEKRHLQESLYLGTVLSDMGLLPKSTRVLDLGTGAGLPGLPIKIARPDIEVTLLDSHGKCCQFLRDVIDGLGIEGAYVAEGRAEELGRDPRLRESFDVVLARAVAPLPILIEYAVPFLKVGGALAATKGSAMGHELAAAENGLRVLSAEVETVCRFQPPEGVEQNLVVVRKKLETPAQYPRRTGIPSKRPL